MECTELLKTKTIYKNNFFFSLNANEYYISCLWKMFFYIFILILTILCPFLFSCYLGSWLGISAGLSLDIFVSNASQKEKWFVVVPFTRNRVIKVLNASVFSFDFFLRLHCWHSFLLLLSVLIPYKLVKNNFSIKIWLYKS